MPHHYEYGVYYEGRDLGWQWFSTAEEARDDLYSTDQKYLPGHLARRWIEPNPPEFLGESRH